MILFQNEESLVKLQELLKLSKSFDDVKITLRQLDQVNIKIEITYIYNNQCHINCGIPRDLEHFGNPINEKLLKIPIE